MGAGAGVTATGGAVTVGAADWVGAAGEEAAGAGAGLTIGCGAGVSALVSSPAEAAALALRTVRLWATGITAGRTCSILTSWTTRTGAAWVGATTGAGWGVVAAT